jgi:hypothetical protein
MIKIRAITLTRRVYEQIRVVRYLDIRRDKTLRDLAVAIAEGADPGPMDMGIVLGIVRLTPSHKPMLLCNLTPRDPGEYFLLDIQIPWDDPKIMGLSRIVVP